MANQYEPKSEWNRIGHINPHFGTLRSYKADMILTTYKPRDGAHLADIMWKISTPIRTIYDIDVGIFLANDLMVRFYKENMENIGEIINLPHSITHWDSTDLNADIWRMSTHLKDVYPSKIEMFMGENIGEGWHMMLRDFSARWSALLKRDRGHIRNTIPQRPREDDYSWFHRTIQDYINYPPSEFLDITLELPEVPYMGIMKTLQHQLYSYFGIYLVIDNRFTNRELRGATFYKDLFYNANDRTSWMGTLRTWDAKKPTKVRLIINPFKYSQRNPDGYANLIRMAVGDGSKPLTSYVSPIRKMNQTDTHGDPYIFTAQID